MPSICRGLDDVLRAEGAEIVLRANGYAERWVGTVRGECLDWLLILGCGHLEEVLRVYVRHYNQHRPHRALSLRAPDPTRRADRRRQGSARYCAPV